MNFITKNLGWILLLLFFVFMLFIIWSNDTQRLNTSWSWVSNSGSTSSWETDKNLDELMRLINDDETQEEEEEESIEYKENNIDTNNWEELQKEVTQIQDVDDIDVDDIVEDEEEKTGFFARLFGRDNQEEVLEETTSQSGSISWKANDNPITQNVTEESMSEGDSESDTAQSEYNASENKINYNANIIKSSSQNTAKKYVDENIALPGSNLETTVGKEYQIWVQMLKLNDKTFTKKIGLMEQGDIVTQLTPENEFGCFKVRVATDEKIGYVCKKYLASIDTVTNESDTTITVDSDKSVTVSSSPVISQKEIVSTISTLPGVYYKIAIDNTSFFDVILERFTLDVWDILRQISSVDKDTGCVDMKVVGTSTWEHDGKIVAICSPDMVSSYNY